MSYKINASSNRDALFGGMGGGNGGKSGTNKNRPSSSSSSKPVPAVSSRINSGSANTSMSSSTGYKSKSMESMTTTTTSKLSGAVRDAKLKEAKEYQEKANQCMTRGFFKQPDPVAACTFYKRSADAYKVLGEAVLERYMRISSGDTNLLCGAYASAADDYTRAAELLLATLSQKDDDNEQQIRRDASNLHKKAAEAYKQMNETGKSATSMVSAAVVLNDNGGKGSGSLLNKEALTGIEEAIEAFVPDPLNPYGRYRQTGRSIFVDEETTTNHDDTSTAVRWSTETIELARHHLVTRAYSHEAVQQLVHLLLQYREYPSALYGAGAVSALLEHDNVSTLSLSRSYVTETIIALAMGDSILAEEQFLQRHVQKTFYLSSRECQLAEELYRAIKNRDENALDDTRNIQNGPNKSSLANLSHDILRQLVQELRVTGVAKRQGGHQGYDGENTNRNSSKQQQQQQKPERSLDELLKLPTGYEKEVTDGANLNAKELTNELDNLNFDDDDSDDENNDNHNKKGGDDSNSSNVLGDELDELEDDDFDLR